MTKSDLAKIVPFAVFDLTECLSEAQRAIDAFVDERVNDGTNIGDIDLEGIMNFLQSYMDDIRYQYIGLTKIANMWRDAPRDD